MAEVTQEALKQVMGSFASGVTVITCRDAQGIRWGLTVSAFSSVSLDPPLCLVCVDKAARSRGALLATRKFAVNMLSDAQEQLSNHFASRKDDKFSTVAHHDGPASGCPLLDGALATIECEVTEVLAGGDHDILVGTPLATIVTEGKPLLYWRGRYGDLVSR